MDNDASSHDQNIIDILKGLESKQEEYPAELLAARRKLYMEWVEQHSQHQPAIEPVEQDPKLLELFKRWKALEPGYPLQLLVRRRDSYKQRIAEADRVSVWYAVNAWLNNLFAGPIVSHRSTSMKFARASALALGIAMFAFVAFALYGNAIQAYSPPLAENEIFTPTLMPATSVAQAILVCDNGSEPPLCLANELDNSHDLSYAGNGKARPAVAKDSFANDGQVHHAAHLNDGLYGPGTSWVSNSPNSWIKIDLGITTDINTIAFGRDRLGNSNDGDPGRFVIAVATSDDVYANGISINDEDEYVTVYDSEREGFNGKISGAETVIALFDMKQARFIKITFENAHTAIDEVEAFLADPAMIALEPTKSSSRQNSQPHVPTLHVSTLLPLSTPLPTDTVTAVPIDTLPPTETVTPVPPTDPPTPVDTPTPIDTPVSPEPTDIPPIYTPIFEPTQEPLPTQELPTDEPME